MTTNTDCTVIRLLEEAEPDVTYIPAVMWQEVYAREVKKYGAENADRAVVYIPDVNADIRVNDFIVKGAIGEGSDLTELCRTALRIASVEVNRFGGENMQHIKAGAR